MGKTVFNLFPAIVGTPSRGPFTKVRAFGYETDAGQQKIAVIASDGVLFEDRDVTSLAPIGGGLDPLAWAVGGLDGGEENWTVERDVGCSACGGEPSAETAEMLVRRA